MDGPGRYDHSAGREASEAYARAQVKATKQAHRTAAREGRRRQRAASTAVFAAHQGVAPGTLSSVNVTETEEKRRWTLGWWMALAMLLAWFGSLPFTVAIYADLGGSERWAMHLFVGMPTVVSVLALLWFLITVPAPRPTVRRVLGAVLLAPLLLAVGMLAFLFTAGAGSLVFAWFLWWQGRPASSTGEQRS